jgi:hypothetical protein
MPREKLSALEIVNAALRFEENPRMAAAALVGRAVETALREWGPDRAREVVAGLVDEAFIEEVAEFPLLTRRAGRPMRGISRASSFGSLHAVVLHGAPHHRNGAGRPGAWCNHGGGETPNLLGLEE